MAKAGPLDGLACIAGINAMGRVTDQPWEDFRRVLRVNAGGTMLAMKHASHHLKDGGAIVLMGSVSAHIATDGSVAYHTSKGAVIGLMRAASGEFAPRGIRVNAVSPGWVDTGFTNRALAQLPDGEAIRERANAPISSTAWPAPRRWPRRLPSSSPTRQVSSPAKSFSSMAAS